MLRPALLTLAVVVCAWAPARAAGPLGPAGSPITTSAYSVDFFTGPVVSSARVTSLGGAYAGLAEGVEADPINAAAPAVRVPWSVDWFDYDFTLGISLPGIFSGGDFENASDSAYQYSGFYLPSAGLNLAMGPNALGGYFDSRTYSLTLTDATGASREYAVAFYSVHVLLARAFWRGQLCLGVGARAMVFDLLEVASQHALLAMTSWSVETGAVFAPANRPFRLGLSARLPVLARVRSGDVQPDAHGDLKFGGTYLPQAVTVPWEVELGAAWELGSRPLNPEWVDPDVYARPLRAQIAKDRAARALKPSADEQELRKAEDEKMSIQQDDLRERRRLASRRAPRSHFLLTASLLVSGPVSDAVDTLSLLEQKVRRSGEHASFTARAGLETEPILDWLQMRLGFYWEPGRITGVDGRLHFTTGFEVKVLPWTVFGLYRDDTWWGVGAVLDVAERYTNIGFRLGIWH
jgi:hypothetical protein